MSHLQLVVKKPASPAVVSTEVAPSVHSIGRARIQRAVADLPHLERAVIRWRFGFGPLQLDYHEIAWRLRLTGWQVEAIERRALEWLRGEFSEEVAA